MYMQGECVITVTFEQGYGAKGELQTFKRISFCDRRQFWSGCNFPHVFMLYVLLVLLPLVHSYIFEVLLLYIPTFSRYLSTKGGIVKGSLGCLAYMFRLIGFIVTILCLSPANGRILKQGLYKTKHPTSYLLRVPVLVLLHH